MEGLGGFIAGFIAGFLIGCLIMVCLMLPAEPGKQERSGKIYEVRIIAEKRMVPLEADAGKDGV